MSERVRVRAGDVTDAHAVIRLLDEAQAWLIANGRSDQWGTTPFSARPEQLERVRGWAVAGGLVLAELDGKPVGALVLGPTPDYAPRVAERELYVRWFVTDRALRGVGAALLAEVRAEAVRRGVHLIRTDCWAGGDGALVRYYERAGFTATERLRVGDWDGWLLTQIV